MKLLNTLSNGEVITLLRKGGVGVIPTDTVYGLVCSAADQDAVNRLYALKSRESKPGTIIAASAEQLVKLGIKARYLKAVEQFWPNLISIIIPTGRDLEYLHLGKQSLAVRIPKNQEILRLLKTTGPLLTTSANLPGQPEATDIKQARGYFGDKVDFYVDGGDLSDRKPSTIIRIVDDAIEVLRAGAVKIDENGRIYDV
ncbi:MAG TPA: L-threonylcarbamoyladenylate synthase [Patescibacteria group bacterium]|nr:L-threonylcarbamoyladenylate synthase [Patescibacteria group bacterium]